MHAWPIMCELTCLINASLVRLVAEAIKAAAKLPAGMTTVISDGPPSGTSTGFSGKRRSLAIAILELPATAVLKPHLVYSASFTGFLHLSLPFTSPSGFAVPPPRVMPKSAAATKPKHIDTEGENTLAALLGYRCVHAAAPLPACSSAIGIAVNRQKYTCMHGCNASNYLTN